MKVKSVKRVELETPEPVYDVMNATPNHNFAFRVGNDVYCISHNCAVLDEVDFVKGASIQMEKSSVMKMYRSVKRRMESRYAQRGTMPGVLFLVSSKKSEHDFLEQYVKTQVDNEHVLIVDEPLWNVKPSSNYSGERFKVAVGNNYIKSRILSESDDVNAIEKLGYRVIDVPVEHYEPFKLDIDAALMDIAGVSVASTSKFISYDRLKLNYSDRINPFSSEVLTIGLDDTYEIKDFFTPDLVSDEVRSQPGFIHLDLSLKGDHTGISLVTIDGTKAVDQYTRDDSGVSVENNIDLSYRQVFTIGLEAPTNSEISLEKTRQFIYYLKSIGFNIQGISADGYQSADTLQQLKLAGFNTKLLSLDRTVKGESVGYLAFRAAINEERLNLLDMTGSRVERELIELEQDGLSGKVDHPTEGCFTGDTKISLVDGREVTIDELMIEQEYRDNYVYTVNEDTGHIEAKRIRKVFQTKITSDLVDVYLDTGEVIRCTPNHKFMTREGNFIEAQSLETYQSLMPLYRKVSNKGLAGYRMIYDPEDGSWHYEHRMFCPYSGDYDKEHVVHHCNYNKLDNSPTNLKYISRSEHQKIHNNSTLVYSKVSDAVKRWHEKNRGTKEYEVRSSRLRDSAITFYKRTGIIENARDRKEKWENHIDEIEKTFDVDWNSLSANERISYGVKLSRMNNPEIEERIIDSVKQNHRIGKYNNAYKALAELRWYTNGIDNVHIPEGEIPPDGYWLGRTISDEARENLKRSFAKWSPEYREQRSKKISDSLKAGHRKWITNGTDSRLIQEADGLTDGWTWGRTLNHKVVAVVPVHEPCRVYDLEIEDNHNFALSSGVFVHNSKDEADSLCGAMYNASLSGASTSIRHAAEDAETVSSLLIADAGFLDDLNDMFGLGDVRVMNTDDEVASAMNGIDDDLYNGILF